MPLTEHQVKAIANDARIALSDNELTSLTFDLNQILETLQVFDEFDLAGVEPTYHPIAGLVNVMRDDVVIPSMPVTEALANAAAHENGQFKVPPILSDGGGE